MVLQRHDFTTKLRKRVERSPLSVNFLYLQTINLNPHTILQFVSPSGVRRGGDEGGDMAALPSLAPSLTSSLHSMLAADIGNISRITKTHKSLSITPKALPDLKQSMAFEVSAFGVQGKGRDEEGQAGEGWGELGWHLVKVMEIQKENG